MAARTAFVLITSTHAAFDDQTGSPASSLWFEMAGSPAPRGMPASPKVARLKCVNVRRTRGDGGIRSLTKDVIWNVGSRSGGGFASARSGVRSAANGLPRC
ncbi:hypothetical protein QO016_002019 [Methylobacterium persicinum]|uniref:Secreted protein n=1 Tax=Methylobacterium persicinum TaxID=374426 RepID=A0ABU0HLF5_9HYPH|nr:hypothetical protein [Methylobacterium persicinum]GJE37733.1 hypothetical protein KHHGKMAE_1794 [Methylobacterium persicinum]